MGKEAVEAENLARERNLYFRAICRELNVDSLGIATGHQEVITFAPGGGDSLKVLIHMGKNSPSEIAPSDEFVVEDEVNAAIEEGVGFIVAPLFFEPQAKVLAEKHGVGYATTTIRGAWELVVKATGSSQQSATATLLELVQVAVANRRQLREDSQPG